MSRIQVLDSDTVNQIAAGEVVERPSHLIKELLENSLDAGADVVHVEISQGGRFLKVKDNGHGIYSDDLELALQRHATSKIKKTDDLWKLRSFGFRGEALASASAVSKLTLRSREKAEKKPSQVVSDFGVLSSLKPSSLSQGTEVVIEDLFENVPARLKFLKSASAENQQMRQVVRAMALSRPEVEFRLTIEGKLDLLFTKADGLLKRAQDVLQIQKLHSLTEKMGDVEVEIIFSSPDDVAKVSKNIWIFVQNRWVQDRSLQVAIQEAYRSLLMHGEYPYAVLKVSCPTDQVDVNIHPTKTQVKFLDSSVIFKAVHGALRRAIEKAPWLENYQVKPSVSTTRSFVAEAQNMQFESSELQAHQYKTKSLYSETEASEANRFAPSSSPMKSSVDQAYNFLDSTNSAKASMSTVVTKTTNSTNLVNAVSYWGRLHVIGQLNLTYILTQTNDKFILVDQHAAHERVVFESLMESYRSGHFEIQNYLFPLTMDLSAEKIDALENNTEHLKKMGFEVERLGPQSMGIKSAPALIKDSGLPAVFEKMAIEIVDNGGSFVLEKRIIDLFATMACHSVVRAGQSLSHDEMKSLLNQMDRFHLSSFCPHGRPVSVELTFTEIEKMFGRIPG